MAGRHGHLRYSRDLVPDLVPPFNRTSVALQLQLPFPSNPARSTDVASSSSVMENSYIGGIE
jgi:hypothetical protein